NTLRCIQPDDRAIANLRLAIQRRFKIIRVNVQPGRRYDHILLSALEVKITLGVEFTDVAGSQPSIFGCYWTQTATPITGRHVLAAHENLAALIDLEFVSGKRLAYRPVT